MKNRYKSYIPSLIFLLAALLWRSTYYVFSLYVALPIFILYCFYNYKKSIFSSKYFITYFWMIFWMFLSSLLNQYENESLRLMIPITATFLLSNSVYGIITSNDKSHIVTLSYIALFIYLMGSNILSGDFVNDFDYASEMERHANTKLNANDYAYYALFSIIAWRIYILQKGNNIKSWILVIIYLLSVSISFYVALMTASRQVLYLQIPILLFFFYIDFIKIRRSKFVIFIILVFFVLVFPYVISLYDNSYLSVRSEVGFQEDIRSELMSRALIQGLENPIIGIGLGYNTFFSHTTYTHILARTGFIPFFLFIYIMFSSLFSQWKRYKRTRNEIFLYTFGTLGIIAIAHFTYSYFNEPFMMSMMFLVIGYSDMEFKKILYSSHNKIF